MIIYFADRGLNITGLASTTLPDGLRIVDDTTVEDLDSGVTTFTCSIAYDGAARMELEAAIQVGRFILKKAGHAFTESENIYDSLFQIVETEYDTEKHEVYFYAEDAGLDLINKVVPAMTLSSNTLRQMLSSVVPADWALNLNGCPTGTRSNVWDGENTATERINSIASLFNCEVYYSFIIERFTVLAKVLNVTPKRGTQVAVEQLRLNKEINRITVKKSIANLATALSVTGGTPDNSSTPITLKNYTYSYTDPITGDVYAVDKTTGQMRNKTQMSRWASALDSDGLILKSFYYDTTDKAMLAGQARAELGRQCYPEVNYECDFVELPDGVQLGDRVNIIDEQGELYLEARILRIETSVVQQKQQVIIGEYLLKDAGIADIVKSFAEDFANKVKDGINGIVLSITSSGGNIFHGQAINTTLIAMIFMGNNVIDTQDALESVFGDGASIKWYNGDTLLGTGMTYSLSTDNKKETITARLES